MSAPPHSMQRSIASFLSLALVSALLSAPAWSQSPATVVTEQKLTSSPALPSQNDYKEARNLVRADQLWNKPFDWKEKGASTADIVSHLRSAVGKDVSIEVRSKDTNLSTFELTEAPLGPTLSSVATLADATLWVFPGRLLVAPENLLTANEKAVVQAGTSGEWSDSSTAGGRRWNALDRFQFIAVTLAGTDLKERFTAKGLKPALPPAPALTLPPTTGRPTGRGVYRQSPSTPSPVPPLAYELPLNDLSPATQEILQDLADTEWERTQTFRRPARPSVSTPSEKPPTLAASTIVGFDDTDRSQLQLVLQKIDHTDATKREYVGRWYVSKPQPSQP